MAPTLLLETVVAPMPPELETDEVRQPPKRKAQSREARGELFHPAALTVAHRADKIISVGQTTRASRRIK